jgi:hypothetical protein
LYCATGPGACEEDETVVGEGDGVDCGAVFAVLVEATVETVLSGLFRVCGLEETDDGVVESYYDLVFFGADGYAAAPRRRGHAVLDGRYRGLNEIYNAKLEQGNQRFDVRNVSMLTVSFWSLVPMI